ncbi:MAG: cytochrome b/b6 domain-containing protein [Pseudomonadota bacterium]|nr:cytochrome b/b6 domain-containing protein [Pseudomonadota bacterium]
MNREITVWDKFIRLFHWSLVVLVITSYFSGEEEHWIHPYSGYAIVSLLFLRIVWGFVGSQHAKFSDFIYSPKTILTYTVSVLKGQPKRYLGHNPLGGLMVLALLLTLLTVTFSGMKLYAVEEGKGPLAQNIGTPLVTQAYADEDEDDEYEDDEKDEDEEPEEFWEEVHEASVSFLLLLIALHITGVIFASVQHEESLIKAMITGKKRQ